MKNIKVSFLACGILSSFAFGSYVSAAETAAPATETFKWSGDVRYRHEMKSAEGSTPSAQHYHRLMARPTLKAVVNEETDVEFRLATGVGGNSTNQTLGSGNDYANYTIKLDRAFAHYHPSKDLSFYAGRAKNILHAPGGSDLIFDSDLNFDGLAMASKFEVSEGMNSFFNLGMFWASQSASGTRQDNVQISPQAGLRAKVGEFEIIPSIAHHYYSHNAGQGVANPSGSSTPSASGNTTYGPATAPLYANDFRVWDAGLEFATAVAELPTSVFGHYASNSAASSEKKGYLFGLKVGKLKDPGSLSVSYDYRKLEKDAVIGFTADGDSANGGTDIKSHRVKLGYQLAKGVSAGLGLIRGQKNVSTTPLRQNKLQLDVSFVF